MRKLSTPGDPAAGSSAGKPFLKLKEVQEILGISKATLWRWEHDHGLKVVRIGGVVRVRPDALAEFLSRHEAVGGPAN